MKISVNSNDISLPYATRRTAQRMVSPLCGLDRTIYINLHSSLEPRFIIAGGDLTGVHMLFNQAEPGSYHIGGAGILLNEAVIRTLGETVERYSQFVSLFENRHQSITASYNDMANSEKKIPTQDALTFFSEEQYSSPEFPFQRFDPIKPMNWVAATSLLDGSEVWVPAQLVLLGYTVKRQEGEPWLLPAVTTGTAAHTRRDLALRTALLELIQLDAVMGHWYSSAAAPCILLDERTKPLNRIIERHFLSQWPTIRFHWISSADLDGMTVACVIKAHPGKIPNCGVGIGSDLQLVPAMYKALLEAVGATLVAKLNLVNQALGGEDGHDDLGSDSINPGRIFNLDSNVNFYAFPENNEFIDEKFISDRTFHASELPKDVDADTAQEIHLLVDGFRKTHKEIIYLDLTTDDIRQLGFVTTRVWSPNTLSLCLPSAPPTQHPRFVTYGGVSHYNPHPYP